MSQLAFDRDLAHEIGHALGLGDRTGAFFEPGTGEVNLMCLGPAPAPAPCSDGHVHGTWLDTGQLDYAWQEGVLKVSKQP